jgi:hypothetical protein
MLGPDIMANGFTLKGKNDDLDLAQQAAAQAEHPHPPDAWMLTGGEVMPLPTGLPPGRSILFSGATARYL